MPKYRGSHRHPVPRQRRAARWFAFTVTLLLVAAAALAAWAATHQGLKGFLL